MGLHQATSGSIYMNGRHIDPYVERQAVHPVMQMVFQNPYASLNPRLTVNAILEEPLELNPKYTPRDRVIRVKEVLDQVGLNMSFGERYAHELSGGQRQRIGIARALIMQPKCIILDEPISALDVSIQVQIMTLLERLQALYGISYLFISHDLNMVRYISHRMVVMYLGAVMEEVQHWTCMSSTTSVHPCFDGLKWPSYATCTNWGPSKRRPTKSTRSAKRLFV